MMIRTPLTLHVAGFLLANAALVNSANAAIEINPSTRTFYAQVGSNQVGHGPPVNIPALSTGSHTNWTNTSPTLSWTASGVASQTIVFIAPPSTEASTSENDISLFVNNSSQLVMSIDSTHSRTANATQAGFFGNGTEGIYFTLDEDTPYAFMGEYVATSVSGNGISEFRTFLNLVGAPNTTHFNFDETFRGDHTYSHSDSGVLPAGTYQWYQFSRIVTGFNRDEGIQDPTGATGEGFFRLALGNAGPTVDPGVVPEAASLFVWGGLAMTALIGNASRRRGRN
jgi:hypothetical protein